MFYKVDIQMDETEAGDQTWLVTVPAFPEITTDGDDKEDALNNAHGAVEEAIAARIHYKEDIPPR